LEETLKGFETLLDEQFSNQELPVMQKAEFTPLGAVKELNWIDEPKKKASDIYKVMANAKVPMPHTVGDACIEVTEQTYPCTYYKATLWCFNRGTGIAEASSVIDCKKKAFEWWCNFVCGFLNCP